MPHAASGEYNFDTHEIVFGAATVPRSDECEGPNEPCWDIPQERYDDYIRGTWQTSTEWRLQEGACSWSDGEDAYTSDSFGDHPYGDVLNAVIEEFKIVAYAPVDVAETSFYSPDCPRLGIPWDEPYVDYQESITTVGAEVTLWACDEFGVEAVDTFFCDPEYWEAPDPYPFYAQGLNN